MNLISEIVAFSPELTRIRRYIYAHPELGFQEKQTSDLVAQMLRLWGIEVHRNIGKTGIVGVIRGETSGRRIGLRAGTALTRQTSGEIPDPSHFS